MPASPLKKKRKKEKCARHAHRYTKGGVGVTVCPSHRHGENAAVMANHADLQQNAVSFRLVHFPGLTHKKNKKPDCYTKATRLHGSTRQGK